MLNALLPQPGQPGGLVYRGSPVAPWLVGAVLLVKLVTALGSVFNGRTAASVADGIPIDSFTPAGASTVVALFGALGVSQAWLAVAGGVVLWRYRALLPAFTLLLLLEMLTRKAVTLVHPIARASGSAGTVVNGVLLALLVLGLVFALRRRA